MKIVFKVAEELKLEDLQQMIEEEDIGYDPDFPCSATLVSDEKGHPVWVTAWSGFTYTLLETKKGCSLWQYEGAQNGFLAQKLLPEALKNAECGVYGERKEQLQDLAAKGGDPVPNGLSEIVSVMGSYGTYFGAIALEQYAEVKAERRAVVACSSGR